VKKVSIFDVFLASFLLLIGVLFIEKCRVIPDILGEIGPVDYVC
jgi:hypothetical protein